MSLGYLFASFFASSKPSIIDQYTRSLNWVRMNTIDNQGIIVGSKLKKAYPEVSGYFIPSLLNWGERDLANQYADWLVSVQSPSGGWYDAHGTSLYTFDTGQILKGLIALSDQNAAFKDPIIRGCDWIISQVDEYGYIQTPDTSSWWLPNGKIVPNAIHLYCLEPIKQAGIKWNIHAYITFVEKVLEQYLKNDQLTNFDTLSHFHAYIIEALVDLGKQEQAMKAMSQIENLQNSNGFIPAYRDVRKWTCSTGLFQYAVIWYKLGKVDLANKTFNYALSLQNKSGGFFGGYGRGSSYFPKDEISWAVKYFLDALFWKIKMDFNSNCSLFPDSIDPVDGRYLTILKELRASKAQNVIDIGCGKGRFLKLLLEDYQSAKFTGLDLSEEMLSYLPENVLGITGSLLNIPVKNEQYDFGFSVETLEHAVNIPLAIREMARVIKKGGTILIIDKNRKKQGKLKISEWEQWFSEDELTDLLINEGFKVTTRRQIPYDGNDGSDELFICWIGQKL